MIDAGDFHLVDIYLRTSKLVHENLPSDIWEPLPKLPRELVEVCSGLELPLLRLRYHLNQPVQRRRLPGADGELVKIPQTYDAGLQSFF
jgi:hypothetical protein